MTHVIGLTGSIGMGKSTTAQLFADRGVPVWDADKAVRDLYAPGGGAAEALHKHFPHAIIDGAVSKDELKLILVEDPDALSKIEDIVHPLVADHRASFLSMAQEDIVLLDVPLLFETNLDEKVDTIVVVSVDAQTQKDRVLVREGMTEQTFAFIRSKQVPDAEKRSKADYVIETYTLEGAARAVDQVLADIREALTDA